MNLKFIITVICMLIAFAGGALYYFFYPPLVYERITQNALNTVSKVVAIKDRAQITQQLAALLTDSAHIRLEVSSVKLFQPNNPSIVQEFDPATFVTFIDNTLYSMQDYAFSADIRNFDLSKDKTTASLAFHVSAWADGSSSYEGTSVNLRFNTDTLCTGHVAFQAKQVRLSDAACVMQLAMVPKSGEEQKLQNPAVMKGILR